MINYSKSFNTNISKDNSEYIEQFFILLANEFKAYEIVIEEIDKYSILFKKRITQFRRRDALAPLREGIVLVEMNNNAISIRYKIRFIKYFIISLIVGVIFSIVLGMYVDYNYIFMLKVFLITALSIYFTGFSFSVRILNKIIKRNIYKAKKGL